MATLAISAEHSYPVFGSHRSFQQSLEIYSQSPQCESVLKAIHLLGSKNKASHILGGQSTNKNWIRMLKDKATKKKVKVMPETLIKVMPETLINVIKENTLGIANSLTSYTND
ncbi:hypothetical protein D9615_008703 [Tricholomella constricta]|uniref:Uncharacterized protein n=1 Tax=Tricholomella constricta TaxID=117010 RepID=A0A8H5H829_9AGAR|nr:hypothetical protein D9615_008703 [Tricholomella constricta]